MQARCWANWCAGCRKGRPSPRAADLSVDLSGTVRRLRRGQRAHGRTGPMPCSATCATVSSARSAGRSSAPRSTRPCSAWSGRRWRCSCCAFWCPASAASTRAWRPLAAGLALADAVGRFRVGSLGADRRGIDRDFGDGTDRGLAAGRAPPAGRSRAAHALDRRAARLLQLSRFYRSLGLLLSGGIPVTKALGMANALLPFSLRGAAARPRWR